MIPSRMAGASRASQATVSVIVPTFNGAGFIADTLRSILAQTHPPLEVIVVDDGSDDGTAEVLATFGDRVRRIAQSRSGPAAARNAGIQAARGRLLAFLDHDDLWVPDKLALQVAAFAADPALGVCVGHLRSFRGAFRGEATEWEADPVPGYLTITMLARREAFGRVGLLDPAREHSDSADWFLRAADAGVPVRLLPDLLTLHRVHASNHSLNNSAVSRAEFLRLARERIERARRLETRDAPGPGALAGGGA